MRGEGGMGNTKRGKRKGGRWEEREKRDKGEKIKEINERIKEMGEINEDKTKSFMQLTSINDIYVCVTKLLMDKNPKIIINW